MSYYWFSRQEILQKAKEKYSKESCWVLFTKQRSDKKKTQRIDTKTCQKKKETRLKGMRKLWATDSVQKRSIAK